MERYRILPQEHGIRVIIPAMHRYLLEGISPQSPVVVRQEAQGTYFAFTGSVWGFNGTLYKKEERGETTFFSPLNKGFKHAHSQSLNTLFGLLMLDEARLEDPDPYAPLITVLGLLSENGFSGHDMSVELSPEMRKLLAQFTPNHEARIAHRMRTIAQSHCPKEDYPFFCETETGLSLVVPGSETYLSSEREASNMPVAMNGHNIDARWQQAALLAGLAETQAIAELIRSSS